MRIAARTLSGIVSHAEKNGVVRKAELRLGDCVVVATANSVYAIAVEEGSTYRVRGGWFDRQGTAPVRTSINGCTWGGRVIQTGIVAAVGLHLEFSNQVVTSPIREFRVIRGGAGDPRAEDLAPEDQALLSDCGIRWPEERKPVAPTGPVMEPEPARPFTTAREA
jgi:hypothetical protein